MNNICETTYNYIEIASSTFVKASSTAYCYDPTDGMIFLFLWLLIVSGISALTLWMWTNKRI